MGHTFGAEDKRRNFVELYEGNSLPLTELLLEKVNLLENNNKVNAFFLADLGEIYRKLEDWRRLLPRVEPFYALKCNSHPLVARFLADAGVGFDCASQNEIEQILNLGVDPSRIIYANTFKQSNYITYTASKNVDLMTFDGIQELVKIKEYFPNARLILRIKSSEDYKGKHNFNKKFGCYVSQSGTLLAMAWAMKMNVVGVSFHVGSVPGDRVACYSAAIADAHRVFKIGQDLGLSMNILDIGGGYPGHNEGIVTLEKIAEVVNRSLDQFFPASEGVRVIAEPGRYIVSAAFTLAVNVIGKKVTNLRDMGEAFQTENQKVKFASPLLENQQGISDASFPSKTCNFVDVFTEDNEDNDFCIPYNNSLTSESITRDDSLLFMYYVNDGIYGAFVNSKIDGYDELCPKVLYRKTQAKVKASHEKLSIIWGPTCDYKDCVIPECSLPELDVGQWLYFCRMGAYSISGSSDFNGIERPLIFPVCSKNYWKKMYPQPFLHEPVKK